MSWFKRASFPPGSWSPGGALPAVALKAFGKSSCYLTDAETKGEGDVLWPPALTRQSPTGSCSLRRSAPAPGQEEPKEVCEHMALTDLHVPRAQRLL